MLKIQGSVLEFLPVVDLERVRDLEYYDGPLLSHFRHRRKGDHYLYYWCDCNETVNRWMILRVGEASIIRLVNRFVPLDYVIPKACQDDFVYFVDMDSDGLADKVTLCRLAAVPEIYVPAEGAYLHVDAPTDAKHRRTYSVLIESNLSIGELSDLPRVFSQAYAFLYILLVLKPAKLAGYPWRGGFSAVHFYRWLLDLIPGEDRPSVATLQYASPGFIRFALDPNIAGRIGNLITNMLGENDALMGTYRELYGYIRSNKLNDLKRTDQDEWSKHDRPLTVFTRTILQQLNLPEPEELIAVARRPFEAAKIALSFVRRVRHLAKLDADGLVRFPAGHRDEGTL